MEALPIMANTKTMQRLMILLLCFKWTGWSEACSCKETPSPLVAAAQADLVFLGEMVQQGTAETTGFPRRSYELVASEVFVGPSDTKVFELQGGLSSCSIFFQEGETYLVYANQSSTGYETHLCTRTRFAEHAAFDLKLLRGEPIPVEPIVLNLQVYPDEIAVEVSGGYDLDLVLESSQDLKQWTKRQSFKGRGEGSIWFFFNEQPTEQHEYFRVREVAEE